MPTHTTTRSLLRRATSSVVDAVRSSDWLAGLATGVVSSTFSTAFVQLGARQIGRDPGVDWMQVGTVPLRRRGIHRHPTRGSQAMGIASHQFADIMWATLFGGLVLAPVPPRHRKKVIAASAVPWAALTAGAEYSVFLPWVQPVLRMQVPYWTAFGVHTASASAYPLFSAFRHGDRRSAERTLAWMGAALAGLAVVRWAERRNRVPAWPQSQDRHDEDIDFLYRMSGHHVTGLRLAQLAADRGGDPTIQALGRLMTAQHESELQVMETWYRSWTGQPVPPLSDEDCQAMEGMPPEDDVDELAGRSGTSFDDRFVELMVPHHLGAIHMSERRLDRSHDPRMRAFAAAIVHTQSGQIESMQEGKLGI